MTRRRLLMIGSVGVAAAAVTLALLFVVFPSGSGSAEAAALAHVGGKADRGSARVLAHQDWGTGQLVLVGFEERGVRRLGLAFSDKQTRGWRVESYTEQAVEPDDVVVGSLLVASSKGGGGQPAWSAAVGELLDARIDRVEVRWSSGAKSTAGRTGNAYLVVQGGVTKARQARYLAKDGTEIANVPVNTGP